MTIVRVAQNTGVTPTPNANPSTVLDGDIGYALFHLNTGVSVTTFTAPPGWSIIGTLGPLGGTNCQSYLCSKNAPFAATDSAVGITAGTTGTTPRWGVLMAVLRDVTLGIPPEAMSDNVLDATLTFSAHYTPDQDSEDALILAGITTVTNGGSFAVTPPSGWTELADADAGFTTAANVGIWAGKKTLGAGTGGADQTIPNGAIATGAPTVRMNAWVVTLAPALPIPPYRYLQTASGPVGMTTYRKQ